MIIKKHEKIENGKTKMYYLDEETGITSYTKTQLIVDIKIKKYGLPKELSNKDILKRVIV